MLWAVNSVTHLFQAAKAGRDLWFNLLTTATADDFRVIPADGFWKQWHEPTSRVILLHDADTPDEKCISFRVVKTLYTHTDERRGLF